MNDLYTPGQVSDWLTSMNLCTRRLSKLGISLLYNQFLGTYLWSHVVQSFLFFSFLLPFLLISVRFESEYNKIRVDGFRNVQLITRNKNKKGNKCFVYKWLFNFSWKVLMSSWKVCTFFFFFLITQQVFCVIVNRNPEFPVLLSTNDTFCPLN